VEAGEVRALNIHMDANGVRFDAKASDETYHIASKLPGSFNVYNCLAAVCVGRAAGLSAKQIEKGIAALPGVAGRMEPVDAGQKFAVIVDYAHTPDALENVLKALRESTTGSLRLVFGATGDRDKTKREPMGEVAAKLADRVYLTDDETYTEDPLAIREAIKLAFAEAKPGDTVLLAGIGHQDYRAMGGKKLKWDEREVARKALSELVKK
jgi:UDP-N-acetylmuramoyl-L-alanyl-D-glutamate--2,6-diaminopimelate ligase